MRWIACLLLALPAACAATEKEPSQVRTEKDKRRFAAAVERRAVLFGMTKSEVLRSRGEPLRKRRERYYNRLRERWDYAGNSIYFDDEGYVVGIEGY